MKLIFSKKVMPLTVSEQLKDLLSKLATDNSVDITKERSLIFNFRDDSYDPETGGYHPVEIRLIKINDEWQFDYITDFAYVGNGYMAELVKEIDFDFSNNIGFQLYIGSTRLSEFSEFYISWESNFISYVKMKVFTVKITSS